MVVFLRKILLPALLLLCAYPALGASDAVTEALAQRIQELAEAGGVTVHGVPIVAGPLLAEFYARRDMQPAWTRTAQIDELLAIVAAADKDGLDPDDYLVAELTQLRQEVAATGSAFAAADLDILLTESLTRYGFHQRFGKVDDRKFDPNINFRRELVDGKPPVVTLQQAIDSPSLRGFLDDYFPRGPVYRHLRAGLATYREIAANGGWGEIAAGPTLRKGDVDSRVESLRRRLAATGDLPEGAVQSGDEFDEGLELGVRNFQELHALDLDGAVGAATLAALNVPVGQRIDQLRLSLERLRWVSEETATGEFVAVNIVGFRAFYVRDTKIEWVTRAMVGKAYRQTPVFRGDIRYLVLNPTWTIPPGILRNDVLPAIKRDPNYLAERNISVIDRDGRTVDPSTVDWNAYSTGVPYTLRQEPGPNNALGTIKFIFPNEHFVFMHDTPSRYLFDRAERAFSSGCIRIEDPLHLAELLLDDGKWDRQALQSKVDGGVLERVNLREPMPVLILYLTASVEPDGRLRFLKDIYERDAQLLDALNGAVEIVAPDAT